MLHWSVNYPLGITVLYTNSLTTLDMNLMRTHSRKAPVAKPAVISKRLIGVRRKWRLIQSCVYILRIQGGGYARL